MIVGLAQTNIVWEDKKTNLEKVKRVIDSFLGALDCSEDTGGRLLLFPEMSLTGFSMNTEVTAENDEFTLNEIKQLAAKNNITIGIGWVRKNNTVLCENHYSLIDNNGAKISDYIKIHPFSYSGEDRYFAGGDSLAWCQVGEFKVATAICFDLRFPEIFQIMSDNADMIIVPANWPERRSKHWKTLLAARAIENQCYIAGINCCGMVGDQYYSGDSGLYSPGGEKLSVTTGIMLNEGTEEEQIFIYTLDNDVRKVRKSFPVKSDRKIELYKKLMN